MNQPRYRALERRFLELISQPRPLAAAAVTSSTADPGVLPLTRWIRAPDEQLARTRLGIYQHMYFARLRDSLREDFELVARLLPAPSFDPIAARYLERHPSDDPSLRYHGRHFPRFLRDLLDEPGPQFAELRPDTPDLASLEWARIEAFDAASRPPLTREQLLAVAASPSEELRLRRQPSVQVVETRLRVSTLWQALESDQAPPAPERGAELMLVWRRGFQVYHRAATASEAHAVQQLEGVTLQELCGYFADSAATPEQSAHRAFQMLDQWLADELIASP